MYAFRGGLAAAVVAVAAVGCSVDSGADETQELGVLHMELSSTVGNRVYELRNANFRVLGDSTDLWLNGDNVDLLEQDLPPGDYTIALQDFWRIEVTENGTTQEVTAALMSENPVAFSIAQNEITPVVFEFEAGDGVIPFGNGRLQVGVSITENNGGGTGGSGSGGEKFVGNITTNGQIRSDFIDYWDQLTPENATKWGSVEATRDSYTWTQVDNAYNFSRQQGIPFTFHTFIWGNQAPNWINGLSPAEQAAEIEEWISDVCTRYPDIEYITVVNEALPGHAPATFAQNAFGADWIERSFELARQYCTNSTLLLNDYNVLVWQTAEFVQMAAPLVDSGLVDGIGAQAYGLENTSINLIEDNLNQVLSLGLPVYITEYSVDRQDDQQQLAVFQQQFPFFYEHPDVHGITLWGYVYGATSQQGSGLLRNGAPRPALTWLMDYLGR